MSHTGTVLAQWLKLVPRHGFQTLAKQHHVGQALRKTSRWDQFTALFMAPLSGRQSLRDIDPICTTSAMRSITRAPSPSPARLSLV